MTLSCFASTEAQLVRIAERVKQAGLFDGYEEQVYGENIMVVVRTRSFEEREKVKAIFREAGITEYSYEEDSYA